MTGPHGDTNLLEHLLQRAACRCGCPADMHVGEIGCPCALPGEPPCAEVATNE